MTSYIALKPYSFASRKKQAVLEKLHAGKEQNSGERTDLEPTHGAASQAQHLEQPGMPQRA